MRCVTFGEVLFLHGRLIATSGGTSGVRDLRALEAAIAQPKATFGGEDLYPTVIEKAGCVCFSPVQGHPFVDGNKRVGHASMEVFLALNRWVLEADVDEQERLILALASGKLSRCDLVGWLKAHVRQVEEPA